MKDLVIKEISKIYKTKIVQIVLLVTIVLAIGLMLFASTWDGYCANDGPLSAEGRLIIPKVKENMHEFQGEISESWASSIFDEEERTIQELLLDPNNLISEEECQQLYGDQADLDPRFLIKYDIQMQYLEKYEDIHFWSRYYERADQIRDKILENINSKYSGVAFKKAERIVNRMFDELKSDSIYYDYNYGWHRFRNVHAFFSYTMIIALLAGLAPIFASEGTFKTESIILSQKLGRKKDVIAKIIAGIIFSISTWLIFEIINLIIVIMFYGLDGGNTVWPDWVVFWAPYSFNNAQFTVVTVFTSLIGVIYVCSVIILISSLCDNQYTSIVVSAVLLYIAELLFGSYLDGFSPIRLSQGFMIWQGFKINMIFGVAIPEQILILLLIPVICAVLSIITFFHINHKEVRNT